MYRYLKDMSVLRTSVLNSNRPMFAFQKNSFKFCANSESTIVETTKRSISSCMTNESVNDSSLATHILKGRTSINSSRCHKLQRTSSPPSSSSAGQYNGGFYLLGGFLAWLFDIKEEDEDIELMEDKILMKIKRAILAIQREQYPKAENYLNVAYKMAEEENLEDVKTQIIAIQANLSLQLREFSRAEPLFKIVVQRLVNKGRVDAKDNSVVEISIKLAEIYKTTGRYEEAKMGYQYCVETQREKVEKDNVRDEDTLLLFAWALHGLAQMSISLTSQGEAYQERIQESIKLIKEAYNYVVEAVGADSHQAVVILSDIATTSSLIGQFDFALKTVQECTELAKDKYEDLYANLKINTGNLFLQKGEILEAEKHCLEANVIANTIQDSESKNRSLECLAKVKLLQKEQKQKEGLKT